MLHILLTLLLFFVMPAVVFGQAMDRTHVNYRNPLQHGSACNATTLNATITAIGSNKETLIITKTDRAKAACTWTLASNVTTNANTNVYIPSGVVLSPNTGVTVTFNGPVQIDDVESLQGAGAFVFNYPQTSSETSFITAACSPTVPSSSLTFGAFACKGSIAIGDKLFDVAQASAAVGPLGDGDGTYWLAFDFSKTRTVAAWTRSTGTHILWQKSATAPAPALGTTIFAQVTVAADVITAVVDQRIPRSYAMRGVFDPTDVLYGARTVTTLGLATTDYTTAVQAAVNRAGIGGYVFIPQGYLKVGNITLPAALTLQCAGRTVSGFIALAGTTGYWFTDTGNAAKISIIGCSFYGNSEPGITAGLRFGKITSPLGSEGSWTDLWVRDLPNGKCYELSGNVMFLNKATAYNCTQGFNLFGTANFATDLVAFSNSEYGAYVAGWTINRIEIEATDGTGVPLLLFRDSHVEQIIFSIGTAVHSHLVELDAATLHWTIGVSQFFSSVGGAITNGNFKQSGTYFGGIATTFDNLTGTIVRTNLTVMKEFTIRNSAIQAFQVELKNNAGVLEHKIGAETATGANGIFQDRVVGATALSYTVTPTGADTSTAFAAGAKISNPSTNLIIFNTASQAVALSLMTAVITNNTTTTPLTVIPAFFSFNVNGVTRVYFTLSFYQANGTGYILSTMPVSSVIRVQFMGFLQ